MNTQEPWTALCSELWKRFSEPFTQPSYVIYFLLALILGAMGVWAALAEGVIFNWESDTQKSFFRAFVTFFPAIGSVACVQVIIVENSQKSIRALFSMLLIVFLSLAIVSGLAYPQNADLGFNLAVLGTALAALCLWLTNINQDSFKETTDPTQSMGGAPENELVGDAEGFAI